MQLQKTQLGINERRKTWCTMHMQINDYIKHGLKKKRTIMPTSCTWLSVGWHPNPATTSIPGCMEAVKRMAANPKDVVHNLPRCLISLGRLGGKRALEGWRNKWWELKASNVVLLTKCKQRKSLLIKSGRSAGHESQAANPALTAAEICARKFYNERHSM